MSVIPLSSPDITDREIDAVTRVLSSGRLSIGPRQDLFEQMVADRTQRRHAIAVSSGTAALHMLLRAMGVGPGDEVITTPFSFIASANCILMVGATPVFVDICPTSLNMDPNQVEAAITSKTRAIISVDVFGCLRHQDRIEQIANRHELALIEDSCEALGGMVKERAAGSFGRAGVFGFYPNKQITTGEGGMIVTDDQHLADQCRSLRNQGRAIQTSPVSNKNGDSDAGSWLAHEQLGYNYRLSEIAAALGVAQMERLDHLLEQRRRVAAGYMRRLMGVEDLILPNVDPGEEANASWFVFVVRLSDRYSRTERDRIITGLRRHEVGASNYFPCIHLQPFYRKQFNLARGMFPVAESISERTIALPFFTQLDDTQIELVCHTLSVMLQREQLLKRD